MKKQEEKQNTLVISYLTLRKTIGWLGILLPFTLIAGNYFIGSCHIILGSISQYYFSATGDIFVAILCAVGLFLICYRGYTKNPQGKTDYTDQVVSTFAGICAILAALVSTNCRTEEWCTSCHLENSALRNKLHYIFAGLFFAALAYISIFRFTISKHNKSRRTERKQTRNKIYRTCGILIVLFVSLTPFEDFLKSINVPKPVLLLEVFTLIAFGTSWLVKGEFILEDAPSDSGQ